MAGGNVTYEIDFAAQIARLVQGTEQGANAVKGMADQVKSASDFAKSALEALGVTLSVRYFENLISGAIEAQARMGELAIVAGTTGAAFSAFEEPARLAGTSLDQVATSIARLGRSLTEAQFANPEKKSLFAALGIDPADGRAASDVMLDVAAALVNMTDKNAAAYISQQLLGKSFAELRPFMAQLVEQGQLNSTMTDEQIARAKELKDEYERLRLQLDQNIRQVSEGMLPTLKLLVGGFSDSAKAGEDFVAVGQSIGDGLRAVASVAQGVVAVFELVGKTIGGTLAVIVPLLAGDFKQALAAFNEGTHDVGKSAADAGERINRVWADTGTSVASAGDVIERELDRILPLFGKAVVDASAAARQVMEDKQHYEERLQALKGFADGFAAQIRHANELANIAYREGAIGQKQLVEIERDTQHTLLTIQISSMQEQLRLATVQGDLRRQQELKNGIAEAQAAQQASASIAKARLDAIDIEHKQEVAKRLAQVQLSTMTEVQRLRQDLIEKQNIIEQAEQNGLVDAAEAAKQRELIELQHQAALGNVVAQGELDRLNLQGKSWNVQAAYYVGFVQNMLGTAAQHNKTMFEIVKAANIAHAIIDGITAVQSSYKFGASFGGPIAGAAMAALAAAATAVNVAAIRSQSFEGGGSASPAIATFNANPITSMPVQPPAAGAATPAAALSPTPSDVNITLVGKTFDAEQVRELISSIKDEISFGANITITQDVN